MPLTKSFNETVKNKLQKSERFRRALLREPVSCMIAGDVETGKSVLRKYINALSVLSNLARILVALPRC